MGGRGAASGQYEFRGEHHTYGDEYTTELSVGNVKFVRINKGSVTAPRETMPDKKRKPKGRVYVTLLEGKPKYVTFYDDSGKKRKQLDLDGSNHQKIIDGKKVYLGFPHTHLGYESHSDDLTGPSTSGEKRFVRMIQDIWRKHNAIS